METQYVIIAAKIAVLVFSVVVHEVGHAYAALLLGDKTAFYKGRVTLNPIPHIDPFMSILLPLFLILSQSPVVFGGAKPVPINPYAFRDGNVLRGLMLTAVSGPFMNLLLAAAALILLHLAHAFGFMGVSAWLLLIMIQTNVALMVFNLIPIPPLDGSKVLMGLVGRRFAGMIAAIEPYGMFIIFLLIWLRVFDPIFYGVFSLVYRLLPS